MSILLVVAHHSVSSLARLGRAPDPVVTADTALASLRMPLFFLAAGLFAAGPLAASWRTLLHKRVAFYLYLFVLWTLVHFTFFVTLTPGVANPESINPTLLAMALLIPGPGMWFLYALALFAVVGKLAWRVPVPVQLGVSAALCALVGAGIVQFDSFAWTFMARYFFFFLLGCHARPMIERLAASTGAVKAVAAGIACVGCAGSAVALDIRSVPGVAFAFNVLAVTFGVLLSAWVCRYRIGRPLVALGSRTLPVYLIHPLWLAVVMLGVRHATPSAAAGYALPVVLALVLTVLSLLTYRILVRAGAPWLFALPSRLAYRAPAVAVPGQRRAPVSATGASGGKHRAVRG